MFCRDEMLIPGILPRNIQVVVGSSGGVGTSFLIEFLQKYKVTNHPADRDGLKHLPVPPISFNPDVRFVYIYGNPVMAVVSLFRRNYQVVQSRKLSKYKSHTDLLTHQTTLREFALGGVDAFGLREHFENWHQKYLVHPTIFLRYETIWDHVDDLIAFLRLPPSASKEFPARAERRSKVEDIPLEILTGLEVIYNDFARDLERFPNAKIVSPSAEGRFSVLLKVLLSKNLRLHFYKAARSNAYSILPSVLKDGRKANRHRS
jgi:hypothetical protein